MQKVLKKYGTHEGPKVLKKNIWTHEGPSTKEKNDDDEHMKAHKKKKK